MFCKHCGQSNPDGVAFCAACGKPMGTETATMAPQASAGTPKKKWWLVLAAGVVALVILGAILTFALWPSFDKEDREVLRLVEEHLDANLGEGGTTHSGFYEVTDINEVWEKDDRTAYLVTIRFMDDACGTAVVITQKNRRDELLMEDFIFDFPFLAIRRF